MLLIYSCHSSGRTSAFKKGETHRIARILGVNKTPQAEAINTTMNRQHASKAQHASQKAFINGLCQVSICIKSRENFSIACTSLAYDIILSYHHSHQPHHFDSILFHIKKEKKRMPPFIISQRRNNSSRYRRNHPRQVREKWRFVRCPCVEWMT
jgi:hypothetical protein